MVDRRLRLSGEAFRAEYLKPKRPVLIEGIIDDWPARHLWLSSTHWKTACGWEAVEVMAKREADPLFERNCETHRQTMLFADLVDLVFGGRATNDCYLVANNKFLNTAAGARLMRDVRPPPEYVITHFGGNDTFLWFGPAGTVTPLHHDTMDLILTQVIGTKRVRLYEPCDTPFLYNRIGVYSEVDAEAPDLRQYPLFARAAVDEFDLEPGQILFLPQGHWHHVRSLTPSASVSFTGLVR